MKRRAMAWTLPAVPVALSAVGSGAPSCARSTGREPGHRQFHGGCVAELHQGSDL